METLLKHLKDIQELIKANLMPSVKPPKIPGMAQPTAPAVPQPAGAPASAKNPVNQAQQIQDKAIKPIAVKQAKGMVKTDKNGQWKLDEDS